MKICKKCGVEKNNDMFGADKTRKDGLFPYCKLCMVDVRKGRSDKNKEYMKIYRQSNKDSIKEQRRSYRESNRDSIREYKKSRRSKDNNSRALYETNYTYLTVDEDPILSDDGVSMEVRCKYCGRYFIPKRFEVKCRIQSLKGKYSGDRHLYCSISCKQQCSIYNRKKIP